MDKGTAGRSMQRYTRLDTAHLFLFLSLANRNIVHNVFLRSVYDCNISSAGGGQVCGLVRKSGEDKEMRKVIRKEELHIRLYAIVIYLRKGMTLLRRMSSASVPLSIMSTCNGRTALYMECG